MVRNPVNLTAVPGVLTKFSTKGIFSRLNALRSCQEKDLVTRSMHSELSTGLLCQGRPKLLWTIVTFSFTPAKRSTYQLAPLIVLKMKERKRLFLSKSNEATISEKTTLCGFKMTSDALAKHYCTAVSLQR